MARPAPRLPYFETPDLHRSRSNILLRNHHSEGPILRTSETATCLLLQGGKILGPRRPAWVGAGVNALTHNLGPCNLSAGAPDALVARYPPLQAVVMRRRNGGGRSAAPALGRAVGNTLGQTQAPQHRSAPNLTSATTKMRAKLERLEEVRQRIEALLRHKYGTLRQAYQVIDGDGRGEVDPKVLRSFLVQLDVRSFRGCAAHRNGKGPRAHT